MFFQNFFNCLIVVQLRNYNLATYQHVVVLGPLRFGWRRRTHYGD